MPKKSQQVFHSKIEKLNKLNKFSRSIPNPSLVSASHHLGLLARNSSIVKLEESLFTGHLGDPYPRVKHTKKRIFARTVEKSNRSKKVHKTDFEDLTDEDCTKYCSSKKVLSQTEMPPETHCDQAIEIFDSDEEKKSLQSPCTQLGDYESSKYDLHNNNPQNSSNLCLRVKCMQTRAQNVYPNCKLDCEFFENSQFDLYDNIQHSQREAISRERSQSDLLLKYIKFIESSPLRSINHEKFYPLLIKDSILELLPREHSLYYSVKKNLEILKSQINLENRIRPNISKECNSLWEKTFKLTSVSELKSLLADICNFSDRLKLDTNEPYLYIEGEGLNMELVVLCSLKLVYYKFEVLEHYQLKASRLISTHRVFIPLEKYCFSNFRKIHTNDIMCTICIQVDKPYWSIKALSSDSLYTQKLKIDTTVTFIFPLKEYVLFLKKYKKFQHFATNSNVQNWPLCNDFLKQLPVSSISNPANVIPPETSLNFPSDRPGCVRITKADIEKLESSTYLNDTIIDFYLCYLQEALDDERKKNIFVFPCHFYTMLTSKQGYNCVKNWYKKNIFDFDFLIFPINLNSHWKVAIVCYAANCGSQSSYKSPCIMLFDSLYVEDSKVSKDLRNYLCFEAKKNALEFNFTEFNTPLIIPIAPKQKNSTDCGLYILHYVELFFNDLPLDTMAEKLHSKYGPNWFKESDVKSKRTQISKLLLDIYQKEIKRQILQ